MGEWDCGIVSDDDFLGAVCILYLCDGVRCGDKIGTGSIEYVQVLFGS